MPTSSFWTAEDKIPMSQNKVSIQAENGLQYSLGQQINFVIPADVGYFQPSETYLRMDVRISNPNDTAGQKTRLMLDAETGANVLIRDIRISSGGAQNQLLEEIQNVNILTSLKYDYETNDDLKKKRALTEGVVNPSPNNRNTLTCEEDSAQNGVTNPWFESSTDGTFTGTGISRNYNDVKALLRLPTGIFQNDKIFPLQLTGGMRIEILIESAERVFRQQTNVMRDVNITSNPVYHSINGNDGAPSSWGGGGDNTSALYISRNNNITSVEDCPFVVGEKIAFADKVSGSDTADAGTPLELDILTITLDGSVGPASGGLVKLTYAVTPNSTGWDIDSNFALYSRSVEASATWSPTLDINNVELIVQQVKMPQGYTSKLNDMLKAGGSMNYDFLSYTNFKYSQLSSDLVANIRLPIEYSRCKSILCIPTDSTARTTQQVITGAPAYRYNANVSSGGAIQFGNLSTRSGLVGIGDNATSYQFIYDGKLNPNRKVPVDRIALAQPTLNQLDQQLLIENEKALHMAGIDPLSFASWQKNFFIGRALSLQNGIYDARGRDFNLQIEYLGTTPPTMPHLWNCFVSHLRRIVVRGDSISIDY
jgi:hypothetical protein